VVKAVGQVGNTAHAIGTRVWLEQFGKLLYRFLGRFFKDENMKNKNIILGILYILIAVLFAIGALAKTISDDSIVLAIQWFCAVVFAGLGVWQLTRKRTSA
jgi:hypothetical protein